MVVATWITQLSHRRAGRNVHRRARSAGVEINKIKREREKRRRRSNDSRDEVKKKNNNLPAQRELSRQMWGRGGKGKRGKGEDEGVGREGEKVEVAWLRG